MPQGLGYPPGQRPMGRPQIPEADFPANAVRGLSPEEGRRRTRGPNQFDLPRRRLGMVNEAGAEQAGPEEQALYNRFVSMALLALYDKKMMPKTLQFIQNAGDPVEGVAEVASLIAMRVYTKSQEDGADITGDILLHAGKEIVEAVIEMVETAGIAEFAPNMIEATFYAAADKFARGAEKMGLYDEEQKAMDMQAMNALADSGKLDAMMGEISKAQAGEGAA